MKINEKFYLGDGVYAIHDGYHVVLTTENGLPEDPSNVIVLEPRVIEALNWFVNEVDNDVAYQEYRKGESVEPMYRPAPPLP